jgi:hypothetical protein
MSERKGVQVSLDPDPLARVQAALDRLPSGATWDLSRMAEAGLELVLHRLAQDYNNGLPFKSK